MSDSEARLGIYLEDDPRDIELVRHHLSRSDARIELDGVASVSDLRAALHRRRYDVACIDYNVPGTDAFSVFAQIREIDPDMPIVVVTGSVGEEAVVECMRAGASDLVHKDRLVRLVPALSRALRERARGLERELTHQQLRETHHTLHALVSSSPIAVCTINADRTVGVVWNEAAERLFGWSADQVFGQPLPFVPEDRRSETDALLDQVFAGDSIIGREVTRVRRDGSPVDLRVDAAPLRDAQKAIVGVVAFMSDITEQKRRETQLESSRDELRAIFDGSPILQFALNTDGTVIELNRAFEDATGIPREELVDRSLLDSGAIEPGSRPAAEQALARANSGEPVDRLNIALRARSGTRLLVEATARRTKLFDHDAVMGFAVDVTEQRSLQEQLLQSQKMEAIGRLAGGVAHDFNNILTAINGYLHLATSIVEPGTKHASYLDRIAEATARASRLTHQLLLFSRRAPAEVEPVDVNQTVEEMTKMLARMIGENIELEVNLSPESCVVSGDSGQLGQVIMNLVLNARDAMPDGGTLRITTSRGACTRSARRCESESGPGASADHAVISVSDTGVGMNEQTMARLFEPFFTTKGRDKGTGLGLPVAY
ncbi:MAG: PAS domain S-box protein, partial [Spirochaetota bacterium]